LAEKLTAALLSPEAREAFARSPLLADGVEILAVRTRALDDWLERVARRAPKSQVVLLGAGMDTRAYRLALGSSSVCFEVDMDRAVLEAKHSVLAEAGASPRARPVLVEADISKPEACGAALDAAGLCPDTPTHWVAEGLIEYLPPATHRGLFAMAAQRCGKRSTIALQVLTPSWARRLAELGVELPYTSLMPVETTMADLAYSGWGARCEVLRRADFEASYQRKPHAGFKLVFAERAAAT
jgi:methyltransferase (TIGR00027 family)